MSLDCMGLRGFVTKSLGLGLLGLTVGLLLFTVLFETSGKAAVTGCITHKIKVIGLCRGDCGLESRHSGVADGAGGQTGVAVGVVGGWGLEVRGVDGAAPAVVEQGRGDHGGIGGERYSLAKPVDEDSGYEGAVGGLAYLF